MEISNVLDNFSSAANQTEKKILKESHFNLSVPGRINVAKSMLYSQTNYLGSFLPFDTEQLKKFSFPIEKFVDGNLRISKERIFTEVKNGGLGLTKIVDFLNCQKCGWLSLLKM